MPTCCTLAIRVVIICVFALLAKGLFYEAFLIRSYAISVISISFLLFLLYLVFYSCRALATKVIATPGGITIRKPFNSVSIEWNDIFEFGRFRRIGYPIPAYWCFGVCPHGQQSIGLNSSLKPPSGRIRESVDWCNPLILLNITSMKL